MKKHPGLTRKCEKCGQGYIPASLNQKLCQMPCSLKPKSISQSNEKWLKRKKQKPKRFYL